MSDQTNGGAGTPLPQAEDPDTIQLRGPLWREWSEDEQGTMAAALGAAREALEPPAPFVDADTGTTYEHDPETGTAEPVPAEPDLAAAGVLATGETVTAEELAGMPWYEARVEIYVRNGPPGDEYGQGGDKIAHTRAATQAPSFTAAAERLDAELAPRWQHLLQVAPLADQAPTPDPDPVPEPDTTAPTFDSDRLVGLAITAAILGLIFLALLVAFT